MNGLYSLDPLLEDGSCHGSVVGIGMCAFLFFRLPLMMTTIRAIRRAMASTEGTTAAIIVVVEEQDVSEGRVPGVKVSEAPVGAALEAVKAACD